MPIDNTLKKVVIWRLISILITLFVMYVTTGDVIAATGVTLFLHALTLAAHYAFEIFWEKKYRN